MPIKLHRRYILGLDVSTSIMGICLMDRDVVPDTAGSHIIMLEAIDFKKCVSLWDRASLVKNQFDLLHATFGRDEIEVVVEEPLMSFRPGASSAATIATLLRFNGIVSYIARTVFNSPPTYISAPRARKVCGMKMQKPSIVKKPHKEQVFEYMSLNDLSFKQWPKKKNGSYVNWARDATDAYVIAKAHSIMNS